MYPTVLIRPLRRALERGPLRSAVAALAIALAACSGDKPTEIEPPTGECASAADLQSCVPAWSQFAEKTPTKAPSPVGTPTKKEEVDDLERVDSTGVVSVVEPDVTFSCTEQTYEFVDNPDRAIAFNIDQTVVWPGALIQGRTHRDGASLGGLLQLPVAERSPVSLTLTIDAAQNSAVVPNPTSGTVNAAKGALIATAHADGIATANNITYVSQTYSNERQLAVALKASGRYLGFEASASGSFERTATTNTIAAQFMQQMYVAGVTQPPTPAAFFSDAFTSDKYAQHAALGRIGKDNPPLYVSRIGYGRMMVFTMTAKAETNEIKAALEASYDLAAGKVSGELSARHKAILQTAEIRISQVGGDQSSAINAIRTGDLAAYFADDTPLTTAAPLWFELKSLTGEVALVSEVGTYVESTCVPQLPGAFEFRDPATLGVTFGAGTRQVLDADVNGDGRVDLVFNERLSGGAGYNKVTVALGGAEGGFTPAATVTHPANPATRGWASFEPVVLDIDGDGRDDLAFNHRSDSNVVYVGMSNGDGSYTWRAPQGHVNTSWGTNYQLTVGDLDGDGRGDLLWTNRSAAAMRLYPGLAQDDSTFAMVSNYTDINGNWTQYTRPRIGEFDGQPGGEIVMNVGVAGVSDNRTWLIRFTPSSATTGTFATIASFFDKPGNKTLYQFVTGDIDGVNGNDLAWVKVFGGELIVERAINGGAGAFGSYAVTELAHDHGVIAHVGDVNDDGRADLVLTRSPQSVGSVYIGLGLANGGFSFPWGTQHVPHTPSTGWASLDRIIVRDVNGDGKDDVIWTSTASNPVVMVGIAK